MRTMSRAGHHGCGENILGFRLSVVKPHAEQALGVWKATRCKASRAIAGVLAAAMRMRDTSPTSSGQINERPRFC
jgi:hypothetical protein